MRWSRHAAFGFLAGLLTALAIVSAPLWYMERRVGFRHLWNDLSPFGRADVDLPPAALQAELRAMGAVPDNLPNFTGTPEHDTFLARPSDELGYTLKPNVKVAAYILRSRRDFNLDPPVLYLPAEAPRSAALETYLQRESRVRYTFSTNADALRTTLPAVASERRLLIVGDSVAFGLGVNDEATIASGVQERLGSAVQVMNAGVAGYDAEQIVAVAGRWAASRPFEALVYVANMNDFVPGGEEEAFRHATEALEQLARFGARFSGRLVVVLHADLEYALRHLIDPGIHGWSAPWIDNADRMRAGLPAVAKRLGILFIDGPELVEETIQGRGTIFNPFALFVDHAHHSARGNRIVADAIVEALRTLGLEPVAGPQG